MPTPALNGLRHRRAVAWAAFAALVLLQLSVASHQHRHVLADVAEQCDVCVQLDRSDHGVAERVVATAAPQPVVPVAMALRETCGQRRVAAPPARAPPFI